MRGRPPVPTKLKLLKGTERKCRLNENEPEPPPPENLQPPSHLSPDARKEWERIAPLLEELGIITEADTGALAMYCQSWGEHVKAEREIKKHGAVIARKNEAGEVIDMVKSPWVGISKDARLLAHKFLVEFGLTPASRTRVSGKKKEPEAKKRYDFL